MSLPKIRKTGQDIKTMRFPIRVGQPTVIKPTTTEIIKTTNGINTAPMTRGPSTYFRLFWIKKLFVNIPIANRLLVPRKISPQVGAA